MLAYSILSAVLILLSAALVYVCFFFWREARRISNAPILVDTLGFFILVKIGLYYVLPTILRFISNYRYVRADNISPYELISVYGIELISWVTWAISFLLVYRILCRKTRPKQSDKLFRTNLPQSKILLIVLSGGFIIRMMTLKYDFNDNILLQLFGSIFYSSGLVCGPYLIVVSFRYLNIKYFGLGVIIFIVSVGGVSSRGVLIYSMLFMLFLCFFVIKSRKSRALIILSFSTLVFLYFSLGGILTTTLFDKETTKIKFSTEIDTSIGLSTFDEFEWRFGAASRMGTAFIRLYNRGDSAGFSPIKNSLMGFLPRSINPDKPYPSTLYADDIYSQGMYLIYREIHGYNTYSMVEFPTGGHFYWEFGIIGVLLLSAISGVYIAMCTRWFSCFGIASIPLIIVVFKPWGYNDPKIWVSEIALQIYQIIIPLFVLNFLIKYIYKHLNRFSPTLPRSPNRRRGRLGDR
jgi:hypothetical protein